MLFDGFNEAIIDKSYSSSVKVGWSPYGGGWRQIPRQGVSIDKSAWDWTASYWLFDLILKYKYQTCHDSPFKKRWLDLASWRYRCLFKDPFFIEPGGLIFRQIKPGVMKSGSVVTIVDNSLAQLLIHYRALDDIGQEPEGWIFSLGDDTRQSIPRNFDAYLAALNKYSIVKEHTLACEFAGYRYRRSGIEPLYKGKHAYILLHADPKVEQDLARAYSLLYHRSRDLPAMKKILSYFGNIPLKQELDEIFDGEG